MKSIGVIGGMSWESTMTYYRLLNQYTKRELGGHNSAKILMSSVNFAEIEAYQRSGDWDKSAHSLADEARKLEAAGADFILIATNTMHKVATEVQSAISIPLLHIADATALTLKENGIHHVGLLGTRFTMSQPFYKERLEAHGITVSVPPDWQQDVIHEIIYQELCQGEIKSHSRQQYLSVIEELQGLGAQAVILGCTEIGLLVQQNHTDVPLYDTTDLHALAAVKLALEDK
ncbi:aspartate/glutamate racemase family protein [Enterovibrio nigricans]|uniref:Aspartate racemase n=1 Tax=Enterovibrio nigricans DSM 22720 TaxID=1121868 RepID=A0A1T4UPX9_9GAMM|nr:aspartate/glutamate racemase family protein [Enterovibrio nigricans]PKF51038.1 aspartate/glutamate racemase family protein [Enterovibrio nigricans]SKA54723.1 aspartate racemase [Enterovibrio nigricans DSM 22720]